MVAMCAYRGESSLCDLWLPAEACGKTRVESTGRFRLATWPANPASANPFRPIEGEMNRSRLDRSVYLSPAG